MLSFSSSSFCFSQDVNGVSSSASNLFSLMDVEEEHLRSLFCNLYLLKNKFIEVQSMVSIFFNQSPSSSETLISLESLIQEIANSASNTLFQFQQQIDLIEVNAIELLAKYTHYCPLCEKGFKRDANLRMNMRANGDEYKSSVALTNPVKDNVNAMEMKKYYYSCPQEGCRWNKNHPMFQPLKSMLWAKNHYRRSHCPKMYVCKRCDRKQFAVLSDLRTHEKHCGDVKWLCSCGNTFSRKEKLMGHVAMFIGHNPVTNGSSGRG